jgi:hypothetical protein
MSEYVGWIKSLNEIKSGQQVDILIQSLAPGPKKYESRRVLAAIYDSKEKQSSGDILWLRTALGRPVDKPWVIEIIKELGIEISGKPYSQATIPES